MREIIFRAWDKVSKKYRDFDGMHDTLTINEDGKVEYYNLQNGSGGDEYILEQFTGLVDKNGVKIFEGDKLSTDLARDYLIVEFVSGSFMFNCNDGEDEDYYDHIGLPSWRIEPSDVYDGEVIGNIHEVKS